MSKFMIQSDKVNIQDYYGQLKVDFANKYIGGGALSCGFVQEQVMFHEHPQLYISPLLCQRMQNNQALLFKGFRRYSQQKKQNKIQDYPYIFDNKKMAKQYIVAIDALNFPKGSVDHFKIQNVKRQIYKAYIGFSAPVEGVTKVISGNWGCGAFGGDIKCKFIIQWIACSLANRQLIYCPFGKSEYLKQQQFLSQLSRYNIIQTYNIFIEGLIILNKQYNQKYCTNIFTIMQKLIMKDMQDISNQNQQGQESDDDEYSGQSQNKNDDHNKGQLNQYCSDDQSQQST